MHNRLEAWLKIGCGVLAALLLFRLVGGLGESNPLAHLTIPTPPTLPADTNTTAAAKGPKPGALSHERQNAGTNRASANTATNLASRSETNQDSAHKDDGTNAAGNPRMASGETNVAFNTTNATAATAAANSTTPTDSTNQTTNVAATGTSAIRTNTISTNAIPAAPGNSGTDAVAAATAPKGETNSSPHKGAGGKAKPGIPAELAAMMGMNPGGGPAPELPPAINARINRITDSEILAAVVHPQPMALLGIAGEIAFLRTAIGQTGLIKESEMLGDIKLLRIGINRVLVEQDGQKKELTIFSGYGGESLLPKSDTNHVSTN